MIHSHNVREYGNQEWNQNRFSAPVGYWSNGSPATPIHRDCSNALAVGVNNHGQSASTTSLQNLQLDASQQPIRRRSHRPRGCRGGRKNRKLKGSSVMGNECSSSHFPYLVNHNQNGCDDDIPEKLTFASGDVPLAKGDLSPYHHVKVNNAWNIGSQNCSSTSLPSKKYSPMLPPPVPSALFECHRQMENNMGLRMLPSFDDSDDSAEGSLDVPPPPPPSQRYLAHSSTQPWNETDCEATADTAISSSHSRSASDDSDTSSTTSWNGGLHHRHQNQNGEYRHMNPIKSKLAVGALFPKFTIQTAVKETEGGSLFVTSPRSFLLGITTATGKGTTNGPMMDNVLSSNSDNLQLDLTRNATQTKRRW